MKMAWLTQDEIDKLIKAAVTVASQEEQVILEFVRWGERQRIGQGLLGCVLDGSVVPVFSAGEPVKFQQVEDSA
jgi:hypothetical protein